MSKVVVDGREYEIPPSFTYREAGVIKRISGLGMTELEEAVLKGDSELMIATALIAMHRAGNMVDLDFLLDLPIGAITFVGDEEEASPPE